MRFKKVVIFLAFVLMGNFAFANNNYHYSTSRVNTGPGTSWEQYKLDNRIETKVEPTFWQKVGSWVGNAISKTYDIIKTKVSNFFNNVYTNIKSHFVKSPELTTPETQTQDIKSNIETQQMESIEPDRQQTMSGSKEQIQELTKSEASQKETNKESNTSYTDYYSVAAGAYKVKDEDVDDEYFLAPPGSREADIGIAKLAPETQEIRGQVNTAMDRIQQGENMVMVALQTMQQIRNIELTGEQVRLIAVEQNKNLLNNVELDILKNTETIIKTNNNIQMQLKKDYKVIIENDNFFKGKPVTITNKRNKPITITPVVNGNQTTYKINHSSVSMKAYKMPIMINKIVVEKQQDSYSVCAKGWFGPFRFEEELYNKGENNVHN